MMETRMSKQVMRLGRIGGSNPGCRGPLSWLSAGGGPRTLPARPPPPAAAPSKPQPPAAAAAFSTLSTLTRHNSSSLLPTASCSTSAATAAAPSAAASARNVMSRNSSSSRIVSAMSPLPFAAAASPRTQLLLPLMFGSYNSNKNSYYNHHQTQHRYTLHTGGAAAGTGGTAATSGGVLLSLLQQSSCQLGLLTATSATASAGRARCSAAAASSAAPPSSVTSPTAAASAVVSCGVSNAGAQCQQYRRYHQQQLPFLLMMTPPPPPSAAASAASGGCRHRRLLDNKNHFAAVKLDPSSLVCGGQPLTTTRHYCSTAGAGGSGSSPTSGATTSTTSTPAGTGSSSAGPGGVGHQQSSQLSTDNTQETINTDPKSSVSLRFHQGLPHLYIPLPSRRELCRFTLRPVTHCVRDLVTQLQTEDRGIDRVVVKTTEGTRIATSASIESLLLADFDLVINDVCYRVHVPEAHRATLEEITELDDVRQLVSKLYAALHVDEHQLARERHLLQEMEDIKTQLVPLEKHRSRLVAAAERRTTFLMYCGLAYMALQFGFLARLTWWEYSWDIMEPVTYFVTYGTAIACYAYYVLTKHDFILPEVRDRQFLLGFHRKARKTGMDVARYNHLKDRLFALETDLQRLRDPLMLNLPAQHLAKVIAEEAKQGISGKLSPLSALQHQLRALWKVKK